MGSEMCIRDRCIFEKCIFRKCIFRTCIFRKCIFEKFTADITADIFDPPGRGGETPRGGQTPRGGGLKRSDTATKKAMKVVQKSEKGFWGKVYGIILCLSDAILFQAFMDLGESNSNVAGLKSSLANANSTLAFVNAMLFAVIFPMAMTPDDWSEEGRTGFIAQSSALLTPT